MEIRVPRSTGAAETDFRITKFFWDDDEKEYFVRCVKRDRTVFKDVRLSAMRTENNDFGVFFAIEQQRPKLKIYDGKKTEVLVNYNDDYYDADNPEPDTKKN